MTIHLPENLERTILAAAHSGRYASLDDAMADAASLLVQRLRQEQATPSQPAGGQPETSTGEKPVWEDILELTADVPDDEWDKLLSDLAEQHDHHLFPMGEPQRSKPQRPRGQTLKEWNIGENN